MRNIFLNVISMMSNTEEELLNIKICRENKYRKSHISNGFSKNFQNINVS